MLNFLPKFLLVLTAFAPVLLTTAAVDAWKAGSWKAGWMATWPLLLATFLAVSTCILVMHLAARRLTPVAVSIKSVKPADKELVGFVLAYLLPMARGTSFESWPLFVVLAVFFVVVMTSNAYHTNPLLGMLGWHFYEVVVEEVSYIMVSRRAIHNVRSITKVVSLTDYMLLDISR